MEKRGRLASVATMYPTSRSSTACRSLIHDATCNDTHWTLSCRRSNLNSECFETIENRRDLPSSNVQRMRCGHSNVDGIG